MDDRYCTECRAAIPKGDRVCPSCGVFAGDVFDGKLPRKRRSWTWLWWILVLAAVGFAALYFWPHPSRPIGTRAAKRVAPHVVKDQRDAMQTLRHFLTTSERSEECVALMSKGKSGADYVIAAVDRCKHAQLGEFVVDGKTAKVRKR